MISLVMPTYTVSDSLEKVAYDSACKYRDQVDELIIVEDGGRLSLALISVADIYCYHKQNLGWTKNVNLGWRLANGNYTAIVNSDIIIDAGNIRDLCISGQVVSPANSVDSSKLRGDFFVVPRTVKEERGDLNERMRTYFSDTDYGERTKDIFIPVDTVTVNHLGAYTTAHLGQEWMDEQSIRDGTVFFEIYPDHEHKHDFYRRLGTLAEAILQ